jgi:hypothetical protein
MGGLLEQARKRGARHVTGLGQLFQGPWLFRRGQHAAQRRLQAAFGQHAEQAGRHGRRLLQPGPHQQREQRRRQLAQDGGRAAARVSASSCNMRSSAQALRVGPSGRMHHQHWRQRRQQAAATIGIEVKLAAQDVGLRTVAAIVDVAQQARRADRRAGAGRIADAQPVRRAVREDDDVAALWQAVGAAASASASPRTIRW